MTADYLTLLDGSVVRVEYNMNALGMFTALTGKGLADLMNINNDINMLRTIAWCSVIEGERIEKRSYTLSEQEFGEQMGMRNVVAFSEIFTAQILRGGEKKSPTKGKAPRVLIR